MKNNRYQLSDKLIKRMLVLIMVTGLLLSVTACSFLVRSPEDIEKDNAKYQQILEEKASQYDIDPNGVEVSQGGQYFKIPLDPIKSTDQMDEQMVLLRKWLRFAYAELGNRYDLGFYDRNNPDIYYFGFSDQDQGYKTEYLWTDRYLAMRYVTKLDQYTNPGNEKNKKTPEEFYELTGIDADIAKEFHEWYYSTFYTQKEIVPDKSEHDITFIPGDTIEHYEIFEIGSDKSVIKPGVYFVDMPGRWGVIHITDKDGNTKYRMDAEYPEGHSDSMYKYESFPAIVELNEGDLVYMTNCISTFDSAEI